MMFVILNLSNGTTSPLVDFPNIHSFHKILNSKLILLNLGQITCQRRTTLTSSRGHFPKTLGVYLPYGNQSLSEMICVILVADALPSSLYYPIDNDRHYDMYYYPNLFTDSCTYVTNGGKGLNRLMTTYQSICTIPSHHKVLNTPHSSATLQTCHIGLKKSK